jgi:hypothetical protein
MAELEFIYEPQSTAVLSDRLVFAWTDDPGHPFLGVGQTAQPSQLSLLVTKDSVAFMPWKPWSLRVPVSKDMRFLFNDRTSTEYSEGARFADFGVMNCVGSAAPVTTVQYGILYVKLKMHLIDPVPIIQSVKTLVSSLHELRKTFSEASRSKRIKPDSKEEQKSSDQLTVSTESSPTFPPGYIMVRTPLPTSSSSTSNVRTNK